MYSIDWWCFVEKLLGKFHLSLTHTYLNYIKDFQQTFITYNFQENITGYQADLRVTHLNYYKINKHNSLLPNFSTKSKSFLKFPIFSYTNCTVVLFNPGCTTKFKSKCNFGIPDLNFLPYFRTICQKFKSIGNDWMLYHQKIASTFEVVGTQNDIPHKLVPISNHKMASYEFCDVEEPPQNFPIKHQEYLPQIKTF